MFDMWRSMMLLGFIVLLGMLWFVVLVRIIGVHP